MADQIKALQAAHAAVVNDLVDSNKRATSAESKLTMEKERRVSRAAARAASK
jgi:hypothetical protein